ncbi:hypothetical protein JD844_005962 [Phrynosoma platyrhinos]|uniref:Delta-like protein n=1 Tax=Phrynosoma platyrhinos TaxID=52577 RepID=A0ABQ7TQX3_PHRPL|nr:hypothetical protein JD844_005962 [Phrynosoma platyrhinos]
MGMPSSAALLGCSLLCLCLHLRSQVAEAVGTFELQVRFIRNEKGVLADGRCCRGGLEPPCPVGEQCRTFFRVCLKEYQLRVLPGGPCVLGASATPVLGGNVFSTSHQKRLDHAHRMVVPFDFAWPRSYSLVLEAWDAANDTDVTSPGAGQLMERVTRSGMLNPGEGWQDLWHHGRSTLLDYRVRVRCQEHYYGPACNLLCRPRDDFFGHHSCDAAGNKVCLDGWTGDECQRAVCRQGCHETHGFCEEPGECRCHYGWTGPLCDECILFPGCVHGSCTEPWKCDCETNWGGLLCDKDLNYCGSHYPCKNGGTCANKEPNEYECLCLEGFSGRNCENALLPLPAAELTCTAEFCANGGTCLQSPSGSRCICLPGWSGESCQDEVTACLSQPCSHGGTCRDHPDGFTCLCPPQWMGKTCQIGENKCQMRCHNGGTCQVKGGRPGCACRAGYTGAECETALSICESAPCLHGGQCQETENRSFLCSCPPGFSGTHCEFSPPHCSCPLVVASILRVLLLVWQVFMDLCSPNPCPKGASCLGGEGSYVCSCPEGTSCQKVQETCLDDVCQDASSPLLLYVVLPLALLLILAALISALMALRGRHKSRETPAGPQEPAANNSLLPDAVHLIHNITHGDVEQGPREDGIVVKAGLPAGGRLSCGQPKTDISNEERAKLNQLNRAPALARPSL